MPRATQLERIIAKGQLVPITLMQQALAASQTDVALVAAEVAGPVNNAVAGVVVPFEGEIVAVTAALSAAAAAGTLTITPTIDGTKASSPVATVTTAQTASVTATRGTTTFDAGQQIGAKITTSGTWNGTTADIVVVVWVLAHLRGV